MASLHRNWDTRVAETEQLARTAAFGALRDRIVAAARADRCDDVVDIGSGTGLLSLALAHRARRLWAIDSSPAMADYLRVKADSAGLENIETVVASAVSLPLVDGSADVVVSNYCLHNLSHADKERALAEAFRVLEPGGRLVLGDMMFSLSPATARNRRIVGHKLRLLAARGIPGLLRIARNALRLAAGRWEHPASPGWWRQALERAGFADVEIVPLSHEAAIAVAQRAPEQDARTELAAA